MPDPLNALLHSLRLLLRAAAIDHAWLSTQTLDAAWLAQHENQRVVNSFLFNFIKIQDKIGGKLLRALLYHWREIDRSADADTLTMLDVLNRLEKLGVLPSVAQWDELRELRNALTHEYPEDTAARLANIALALQGFEHLQQVFARIERRLGAQ